jgi:hypothetical protein
MDRYWRVGDPFRAFKSVSKEHPDKFVVGFVLHSSHSGALRKFNKVWNEMKNLVPEDYYMNLKGKLKYGYGTFIIFDTYEQGEKFVEFVEKHFNENGFGAASMWANGEHQCEST